MAKPLNYGDRMKRDPRWVVESTGGGFSGWYRPVRDGAPVESPSWLITFGEGFAPVDPYRGPCQLSLEHRGTTVVFAECSGTADAVALADRWQEGG